MRVASQSYHIYNPRIFASTRRSCTLQSSHDCTGTTVLNNSRHSSEAGRTQQLHKHVLILRSVCQHLSASRCKPATQRSEARCQMTSVRKQTSHTSKQCTHLNTLGRPPTSTAVTLSSSRKLQKFAHLLRRRQHTTRPLWTMHHKPVGCQHSVK